MQLDGALPCAELPPHFPASGQAALLGMESAGTSLESLTDRKAAEAEKSLSKGEKEAASSFELRSLYQQAVFPPDG